MKKDKIERRFPKVLYVKREQSEGILIASDSLFEVAEEDGSQTPYATYVLSETAKVRLVAETSGA